MKGAKQEDKMDVLKAFAKIRDENVEQLLHYVRLAQLHSAVDDQDSLTIGKLLKIQLDRIYIKDKNVIKTL